MLELYSNPIINHGLIQSAIENTSGIKSSCNGVTELIGTFKREEIERLCQGCDQTIHDKYFLRVENNYWHEHCLACNVCGTSLSHTCYTKNSKIFCKTDYDRIFGVKCNRCGDRLLPHDIVMRAKNYVYHVQCFTCCLCCQPLQKGDQYALRSGQIICKHDFEKELYLSQNCDDDDSILDDTIRHRDGRRGPKRPRTILTSAQRRQFKASFELSPKPCRKVREALAKDTGLSVRVVQVWFQNQRAKMKKIQRKAKHNNDDKNDKEKECKSPNSDQSHYLGLDGSFGSSNQPISSYSPDFPVNSNDSFCSSDNESLDYSNFDNLDEATSDTMSLNNLDLPNRHGIATDHHDHIANPIDKLYLMQNSYFSVE